MDGFFVAKLQKISHEVRASRKGAAAARDAANGGGGGGGSADALVDKTPIVDEEGADGGKEDEDDVFGGFDADEDAQYIERARKNAMRRRGLDPKAKPAKGGKGDKQKAKTQ
jgi:ribosomal RNA methyltransferase Nop2